MLRQNSAGKWVDQNNRFVSRVRVEEFLQRTKKPVLSSQTKPQVFLKNRQELAQQNLARLNEERRQKQNEKKIKRESIKRKAEMLKEKTQKVKQQRTSKPRVILQKPTAQVLFQAKTSKVKQQGRPALADIKKAGRQEARRLAEVQIVNQQNRIQQFQNSEEKELTVDLRNFPQESVIQILNALTYRPSYITTVNRGPRYVTVNTDFRNRLTELMQAFEEQVEVSDEIFYISRQGDMVFEIKQRPIQATQRQRRNGNFFPYLNKTSINLEKYGVFNRIDPENYKNNCLQNALIHSGIQKSQVESLIIGRDVPFIKLNEICDILKIKIELKIINKSENVPSKTLKFGKVGEAVRLGHIENHYFINEKTHYTKYSVEHYEEIKSKEDFGHFYNERQRDKTRCASSFDIIKLCLEKQNLFSKMIQTDKLQSTQYYDKIGTQQIETLQESKIRSHINKDLKVQDLSKVFFADFETCTEESIHDEFMCCVISHDKKQKKTFIGDNCSKLLLEWLPADSMVYFHNLGYDSVFLVRDLLLTNEIREGSMCKMISGTYKDKKIVFKDSYAMISSKLSDFPKMFGLSVKKEVMPYALYTKKNVKLAWVPLEEALQHIKPSDIEEFNKVSKDYIKNGPNGPIFYLMEYAQFYCMQDCEVLASGFKKFAEWIKEAFNVSVYNFVSLPSLANECFLLKGAFAGCNQLSGVMRDFIQQSVLGGRCMTAENKMILVNGYVSDFDAVSLYPSAIANLGYLKGKPIILNPDQLNMQFLNQQTGYFIEIKNIVCKKPRKFPLLPIKDENGTLQYVNDFPREYQATVNKITLEDLIKYQEATFTIIKGVYFNKGRNYKSCDFIKECFEQRKKKKEEKNNIEKVYKLLMNSSYGKTMQKPRKHKIKFTNTEERHRQFLNMNHNYVDEFNKICDGKYSYKVRNTISNHFSSPHIGSEILAMSKRIMNSVMCLAEDLNIDIFYQDTDSMHLYSKDIERLSIEYQKRNNNKPLIGENLGQFHTDFSLNGASEVHATKSIFIGKKCYVDFLEGVDRKADGGPRLIKGEHIRLKGVPNSSVIDAANLNGGIEALFMDLYNGDEVTFNLLAGSVRFQRNKDYSYTTKNEFNRSVSFNNKKKSVHSQSVNEFCEQRNNVMGSCVSKQEAEQVDIGEIIGSKVQPEDEQEDEEPQHVKDRRAKRELLEDLKNMEQTEEIIKQIAELKAELKRTKLNI